MVDGDEEDVLLGVQAQQGGAEERTSGEIERTHRLFTRESPDFGLLVSSQVHHRHREVRGGVNDLDGLAAVLREGGPQRLVALDERAEAVLQGRDIQHSGDLEGDGNVVGGIAWLELVDEPQALLGEGQRRRTRASHGYQGRSRRGLGV